jgi:integrase
MRLNAVNIRTLSLPSGVADRVFWDSELPGFGLRIRASGARTWLVQYAIAGRTRRVFLGSATVLDPGKARETAKKLLAAVKLGRDPAAEKHTARVKAGETFGALLPRHLAHQRAALKPRSYQEVERHLTAHCRPLHGRPVDAIDQRAAALLLANIAENSGPGAANHVRASGSGYYSWLIREGLASANPFANTNKAVQGESRSRTPSDAELREIWQACPESQFGAVIKLLMLLAARRDEITRLCWSEVDFDAALITLPPARTKNRREHEIPLSAPALAILQAQPRRINSDGTPRDLVFGNGPGGFQDWRAKHDLDARILEARQAATEGQATPMPHWVAHDFRRSFSTTAHERLGIQPHIVEACLGHVTFRSGVSAVYNRATYRNEKRRALEIWGEHVTAIVEERDRKIIPLRSDSV